MNPAALVSIIIPFYNEEQYLARAVTTAIEQTYQDLEIVLVNDGSTDNSLSIASEFEKKYQNIKLVSTPTNIGLGHARNMGMETMKGAYLMFLDSDDMLRENAVELLVQNIIQHRSDLVIGKFIQMNGQPADISYGWILDGSPKNNTETILAVYRNEITCTVWAKLYRTVIAKNLRFPDTLWFEDRPFLLNYLLESNSISFLKESILQTQSRPVSITRRLLTKKRIEDNSKVYFLSLDIIKGCLHKKIYATAIDEYQVGVLIDNIIFLYQDKDRIDNLKELQKCQAACISAFKKQLQLNQSRISKRSKLDLMFLQLYKIAGWKILLSLVPLFKKRRCARVNQLRNC